MPGDRVPANLHAEHVVAPELIMLHHGQRQIDVGGGEALGVRDRVAVYFNIPGHAEAAAGVERLEINPAIVGQRIK